MRAKCANLVRILPFLLMSIPSGWGQSQAVDCATLSGEGTNATTATPGAAKKGATGSADRQAANSAVAAQIQTRRSAPVRSPVSCRCGMVDAGALTARSSSQEVPILTALPGNFRFSSVLLRETTQFSAADNGKLTVGVGRANRGADVISPFPLRNATAPHFFWYERPSPPQLAGAFDLVLFFQAEFPLGDGTATNLKAGALTWEVCGFNGPAAPIQ